MYELPEELIAQEPLKERSSSRLLILPKSQDVDALSGIEHRHFSDITEYLRKGDCLVLNNTRVIPARLIGHKKTGAAVEILLLRRVAFSDENEGYGVCYECIVRPGKRLREGSAVIFGDGRLNAVILKVLPDGNRIVGFKFDGIFEEILDELGQMPLPPYITHELKDRDRYNTVYARYDGSAAAPTAGLHFTDELLEKIRAIGVNTAQVTLHVGLGTFRPVKEEDIRNHPMHSEYYEITPEAAMMINDTKAAGGRIIAVGTTSTRTLEAAAGEWETVRRDDTVLPPGGTSGETSIFIYPGYEFKVIDGLITNFHLPGSTLIMLVSALAGRQRVLSVYKEAVRNRYRFFSFGDAMFIV